MLFIIIGTFNHTNHVEQTLIDNQCNLFIQDDFGNLPLHYTFINKKLGNDPIQLCSLIIKGMNYNLLDTKNNQGNTPLYLAVTKHSTICVTLLLRHQANLLIENNLSNSSIGVCIASNHLNLFLIFFHQSIDINLNKLYAQANERDCSEITLSIFWPFWTLTMPEFV